MSLPCRLKSAFEQKKVPFWVESFTNQQFVILSDEQKKTLAEKYYFEEMERDEGWHCSVDSAPAGPQNRRRLMHWF